MLRTGERSTLQHLARRELPGLYALARRLGVVEAEDLVQEALVRACRSFDSLRDLDAGGGWLRMIMTNVWRDALRKDGRTPDEVPVEREETFSLYRAIEEEDPFPYSDTLHVDVLGAFSEHDIHVVLDRLPPRYRGPLVLRYLQGFSPDDIGRALDLPKGTVLSQLHRGRQRFERELWDYARESGVLDRAGGGPS